jgi:FkbM family methyltransferase
MPDSIAMTALSRGLRDRYVANRRLVTSLGLLGYVAFRRHQRRLRTAARGSGGEAVALFSKHAQHPIYCRPGTSDFWVFVQVFVELEYSCLDSLQGHGLIIDCGANVGYAAAYLLSRFPHCDVVAIEPDPSNYELLVRNLAPYGRRAKAIRAGIWSHRATLKLDTRPYRDGSEWTRQVVECAPADQDALPATSVSDVLRESGHDRVFMLKMDVEGAEGVVFARDYESWLDRTDNMAIELHDDTAFGACSEIFHRAIAGRPFGISQSGELTVCRRQRGIERESNHFSGLSAPPG